jgi:general stress protein YciG
MSKQNSGFASMSLEQRRAIARLGGQAAHKKGTAHEWSTEEARLAGRKGGLRRHGKTDDASVTVAHREEITRPIDTPADPLVPPQRKLGNA